MERGIFIESSKTRWCASPRYRTSFWEVSFGGEGGIRTLARFYPPNPLAGGPLWPLGYLAIFNTSAPKAHYINYEIKKQPCGWCKKLLIDIVFCSICFRNIWKRIFIPLTILLWNYRTFFIRFFTYSGGRLLRQNPQSRPQRTQAGRDYCFIRHHASRAEDVAFAIGGPDWNWTSDTWIFSPLLLPAELRTHIQDTYSLQNVGLEPTTHCLSDNCSTMWANLATSCRFAGCVFWMQPKDSNLVSSFLFFFRLIKKCTFLL